MRTKEEVLKNYFGYESFKPGQGEVIDATLDGRDVLGVMPTGAGKSICYQVPAMVMEGITLVISPLISLMNDQVRELKDAGINAAYLNSSLTSAQYKMALDRARQGLYKLIYVSPERLETEGFKAFAREADISFVAVDEAHCISQWGQDFRPSYLKIPEFIRCLSYRPIVAAYTATATDRVREDIVRILELDRPYSIVTGFDRPNLYWEVRRPESKINELTDILEEHGDESGIIYCATRKNVDQLYEKLSDMGYPVAKYHAGLSDEERAQAQDAFIYDECPVMIATNAFGMGINKSNVRYVIHYNMPKNMEGYYQEAGRAGRDGEPADCILLYSGQDVIINKFLIKNSVGKDLSPDEARRVREEDKKRLKAMINYSLTRNCLRQTILDYFGENGTCVCGNCSNCNADTKKLNIGLIAKEIIGCILESEERFGASKILDCLKGANSEGIRSSGLNRNIYYGKLAVFSKDTLREIVNQLTLDGYLMSTSGKYPLLKVTAQGKRWFASDVSEISIAMPEEDADKVYDQLRLYEEEESRSRDNYGDDNFDEGYGIDREYDFDMGNAEAYSEEDIENYISKYSEILKKQNPARSAKRGAGSASVSGSRNRVRSSRNTSGTRSDKSSSNVRRGSSNSSSKCRSSSTSKTGLSSVDQELFEALRKKRLSLAKSIHMPPYIVASDKTLIDMATKKPADLRAMLDIFGMGEAKVSKYGDAFLSVIRKYI